MRLKQIFSVEFEFLPDSPFWLSADTIRLSLEKYAPGGMPYVVEKTSVLRILWQLFLKLKTKISKSS